MCLNTFQFKIVLAVLSSIVCHKCLPKTDYYKLELAYFNSSSVDGVEKAILGINGQFPGPTIEAYKGDTLIIDVVNNIQDGQNTSMHWHGLDQINQFYQDGVAMVNQCPLPAGQTQRYSIQLDQHGTYWYHSHVKSQYPAGLLGPLIIHSHEEKYTYDEQFILILHDWYHNTAKELEDWHISLASHGVPPYPDSGLINGHGRYPCCYVLPENHTCDPNQQLREVFKVQPGKTYRVRVINAAAVSAFNFSIDGHQLLPIETDGIDVGPTDLVDIVPIAAGQRYSFLITTNSTAEDNRFLIRANLKKESLMLPARYYRTNINKYPEALMGDVTAVLEYSANMTSPKPLTSLEPHNWMEVVPPPVYTTGPKYVDDQTLTPFDGISAPDKVDQEFLLDVGFYGDEVGQVRRGSFNHTPFVFPEDKSVIEMVMDDDILPQSLFPLTFNHNNVIQLILNNSMFYGPHPFHLHGHDFWVLGAGAIGDGAYNASNPDHKLNLNGTKRDTFVVQERSWGVIRFIADNPGVWIFHCHIDWHMLSGMALAIIESPEMIKKMPVPKESQRVCAMHSNITANLTSASSVPN